MTKPEPDVDVRLDGHVAIVEIRRPPYNFFDVALIASLADIFEKLDLDDDCRAILLAAQGTAFCAGADFSRPRDNTRRSPQAVNPLYAEALRLFACRKPVVAAVHGHAIGGGLGLALVADFRVTCSEARFAANFNRLGFHPGFGLSYSLPRLVGHQAAARLLYTGRRIGGEEATRIGLADELVERDQVRQRALELAAEIAASAPIAVQSTRATLRAGFVDALRLAVAREHAEQTAHFAPADFKEGIAASSERRTPNFQGR